MDYIRRMRDLREDADMTQAQVAAILGTSQTMYARYERGANELPIHHLIKIMRTVSRFPAIIFWGYVIHLDCGCTWWPQYFYCLILVWV